MDTWNTPCSNCNKLQVGDIVVYHLNRAEKQQMSSSLYPKWIACAGRGKSIWLFVEMISVKRMQKRHSIFSGLEKCIEKVREMKVYMAS